MGKSTLGSRGQHLGEYAVMIGVVATALIGTQLYVGKRVAGRLIGMSEAIPTDVEGQALGVEPQGMSQADRDFLAKHKTRKAKLGGDRDDSFSTVEEAGDANLIVTKAYSQSVGQGVSDFILAQAYGPWIGKAWTFDPDRAMSATRLGFRFLLTKFTDKSSEEIEEMLEDLTEEELGREFQELLGDLTKKTTTELISAAVGMTPEEWVDEDLTDDQRRQRIAGALLRDPEKRDHVAQIFGLSDETASDDLLEQLKDETTLWIAINYLIDQELPEDYTVATLNSLAFWDWYKVLGGVREDPESGMLSALIEPRRSIEPSERTEGPAVELIWAVTYVFEEKMTPAQTVVQAQAWFATFDRLTEDDATREALGADFETLEDAKEALAALFEAEGLAVDADRATIWDRETEALQGLQKAIAEAVKDENGVVNQALALITDKNEPIPVPIKVGDGDEDWEWVTITDHDGDGVVDVFVHSEGMWLDLDGESEAKERPFIQRVSDFFQGVTALFKGEEYESPGPSTLVPVAPTTLALLTKDAVEERQEEWQEELNAAAGALIDQRIPDERVQESVEKFLEKRFDDQRNDRPALTWVVQDVFEDVPEDEASLEPHMERYHHNMRKQYSHPEEIMFHYRDILPDDLTAEERADGEFLANFLLNELQPALEDIAEHDDLYGAYAILDYVGVADERGKRFWEHLPFTGGPAKTGYRREDNAKVIQQFLTDGDGNVIMTHTPSSQWTLEGGMYDNDRYEDAKLIFHEELGLPIGISFSGEDDEIDLWFGSFDGGTETQVMGERARDGTWRTLTPLTETTRYEIKRNAETGESLGNTTQFENVPGEGPGVMPYSTDRNPQDAEAWVVRNPATGERQLILDQNGNRKLEDIDSIMMGQRIEVHPAGSSGTEIDIPEPIGYRMDVVQGWMEINDRSAHRVDMLGDYDGPVVDIDRDQLPDAKQDAEGNLHQMAWLSVYNPEEVERRSGPTDRYAPRAMITYQDWNDHMALPTVEVDEMKGVPTLEELRAAGIHPSEIANIGAWTPLKPDAVSEEFHAAFTATGGMRSLTDVTLPPRLILPFIDAQIKVPGATRSPEQATPGKR